MREPGLLLAFYTEDEAASLAYRALKKRGVRRVALLKKSADGSVSINKATGFFGWIGGILGGLLIGLPTFLLAWRSGGLQLGVGQLWGSAIPALLGYAIGVVLGLFIVRLLDLGIKRDLTARYARWILEDEFLVLLRQDIESLRWAIPILREYGEVQPTIFALHPERRYPSADDRFELVPLPAPQIQHHAIRLAQEHSVALGGRSDVSCLRRMEEARQVIRSVRRDLAEAERLEQPISPSAEWILDNEYLIQSHIRDVQINLPKKFFFELPVLVSEQNKGRPRVYSLAKELVMHTDARLDRQNIDEFLSAYQSVSNLTIGELWAVPMMLRITLVESIEQMAKRMMAELREREQADFWANRLLATARRDPDQIFSVLAELTEDQPNPSAYFGSQITGHLYDEDAALVPMQSWLERTLRGPVGEINLREQGRQAAEQVSIGNAISSLRQLSLLDWREVFESHSAVDKILLRDPARVYLDMDFDTRNRYRQAVEEIARRGEASEETVAHAAVDLAAAHTNRPRGRSRESHIGLYLIGAKRGEFVKSVECSEPPRFRLLQWVRRHPTGIYLTSIGLVSGFFTALGLMIGARGMSLPLQVSLGVLLLGPSSQLAVQIVNYLLTRLLPPHTLPKMDFRHSGIPEAFRTLVVIPVLLLDEETIQEDLEKLEIRYLANPEANLIFSLFTDYSDALEHHQVGDEALLRKAADGIKDLNRRYGSDRFYLFHRQRTWTESEQKYIGWERKRGKLEDLNSLIAGGVDSGEVEIVQVGDPRRIADVRFVITLDSDTQLPRDAARRMVETLAHPLNTAVLTKQGEVTKGTYTIIQPRVSTSLPSATQTPFSRLFTDPVGIDPYTRAVSDAYMDLAGEASYHGKGIYDPRVFDKLLRGRFPEQWLLSHDLIEGAHVGVGLASDIELFDEFPPDYLTFTRRQHRWIRGDWQIADWVLPRVPSADGGRVPNPLSSLNRWKIFDNLRRSMVPVFSVALMVLSWLISPTMGSVSTILVGFGLLFQPLAQPLTWATSRWGLRSFSPRQIGHDIRRSIVDAALLPHQAGLTLDAVIRVMYRRFVTHRGLLQWTTAQMTQWRSSSLQPLFLIHMSSISLFSLAVAFSLLRLSPDSLLVASPFLLLWFLTPIIGWGMNTKPVTRSQKQKLPERDLRLLRRIARRTWRYFEDFVGEETSWLPPDNYQVSHQDQLAMRTSPTNIGLWLLTAVSAHDFGYLTPDQVIDRLGNTLTTLGKLERYEGHLLNWYDLKTLAPLEPRYVSAVDSGNFLSCLWTLEQGIWEMLDRPLLHSGFTEGLLDTVEILESELKTEQPGSKYPELERMMALLHESPARLMERIHLLRDVRSDALELADHLREDAGIEAGAAYWARQVERMCSAGLDLVERYLPWVEIIDEQQAWVESLGDDVRKEIYSALQEAPSLRVLASGDADAERAIALLTRAREEGLQEVEGWLKRLDKSYTDAKRVAGELCTQAEAIREQTRKLSSEINMRFLYDQERRLFSIGYNLSKGQLDSSFYDLLASEARLGSFVAIARGDVPNEHWLSMHRPYGTISGKMALLSWTGTMFEYLMPLLFQRTFSNSLLDAAAKEAVMVQIDYGRKRKVPWGISESAYGDLDLNKTYQYRAFGVPGLGLKRGLEDDLVIAPYATLLAVSVSPEEAVSNLRRLAEDGLMADYGYYESIDFSRQRVREGERGVIIRAYMAHHQGMSFLALSNLLHEGSIQRWFHADPRVRAAEPLLYERIPVSPPVHHISTREGPPSRVSVSEIAPSVSKFNTPHTAMPKVELLSNGRYSLMVTNAGGGYSRWGDSDLTRWRADTTRDSWGTYCYFKDLDSNKVWSNTYHPVDEDSESYQVRFSIDRAVFHRADNGIETETEIVVSPEDDVEIRRITLINRTTRTHQIEVTSYIELAMAAHAADRQHPAFSKLFIQTEAVAAQRTLVASRRARDDDDPPIYVAHRLTFERGADASMQYETDREIFIGRGRSKAHPQAMGRTLTNSAGYVLDPILSLRRRVILRPGQTTQFSLILGAAESRDDVLALMEKYGEPTAVSRAMELAWVYAQLELRLLRIHPDDARRFQRLAAHMLYNNAQLRPPLERIQGNQKGQSSLWAYGISGDLPIAVVSIGEVQDISLVRQMLQAHTYMRQHGLVVDLVILNEESSSYEQPLNEQIERLIQANSMYTGVDQPGGVFLRSADQIPEDDLKLILATAHVSLVAARGPLPQQLGTPSESVEFPEEMRTKRVTEEPSARLSFMELPYFNGLGGFTQDGGEYVIYLGPQTNTPMPWVNVIANQHFGTMVSESGVGFTWYGNSQRNRLTEWSNDPVLDPASDAIYIRDDESGKFWNPTALPIRERPAYRARHGAGYSVFEHNSHAIEQELTVFVPQDDEGGEPVRLQILKLRNDSSKVRKLSIFFYVEWTLGENRETSQMHVVTQWQEGDQVLLARNGYHPDYPERVAFAAMSLDAVSYTADRTEFLGRNGTMVKPVGLERTSLGGRTGVGLDPCSVIQVQIELEPEQETELVCILGQTDSDEEAVRIVRTYRENLAVHASLERTRSWWDEILGTIQVDSPELSMDFLLNRWLLYQSLSCRIWGRSAFYQSGGAIGFRDQLQDMMAFLYTMPSIARDHLLLAASRQFREGDVQHWWHPPSGAGIRSRISDDLLWLPYVTAQYVRVTGDEAILSEKIQFLEARQLEEGEHEVFLVPDVTVERASLFEHCRRALERGLTEGPRGLPLIGAGDWNDGLNRVGADGRGESVWLAWFLVDVLHRMADLADRVGESDLKVQYLERAQILAERIEQEAWDGEWYIRATFDDGTPLGSSMNEEARIDSLPQSWAWLSGAANPERATIALESAWRQLVNEEDKLVLLFTPPFDKSRRNPGYIKGYPPGVRENGGQYTHGSLWLAMAMARKGDGDRAARLLRIMNPIEQTKESENVWRYRVEPYVVTADVYHLQGRVGQGGWSWYTGSAAWMYRVWLEEILGFRLEGEQLQLDPVIPGWWDGFTLTYRYGEAAYSIEVQNPDHVERGVRSIEMDGRLLEDGIILLKRDPVKHRIRLVLGEESS